MTLNIKRLSPSAKLPRYATAGAAGLDLHACLDQPLTIAPGQQVMVPTGIAVAIPEGHVGLLAVRSSMGVRHGISLSNGVGVIDWDYRGPLGVVLRNASAEPYTIQPDDRIAQLLILPVAQPALREVEELDDTARGEGGFGSTGR